MPIVWFCEVSRVDHEVLSKPETNVSALPDEEARRTPLTPRSFLAFSVSKFSYGQEGRAHVKDDFVRWEILIVFHLLCCSYTNPSKSGEIIIARYTLVVFNCPRYNSCSPVEFGTSAFVQSALLDQTRLMGNTLGYAIN